MRVLPGAGRGVPVDCRRIGGFDFPPQQVLGRCGPIGGGVGQQGTQTGRNMLAGLGLGRQFLRLDRLKQLHVVFEPHHRGFEQAQLPFDGIAVHRRLDGRQLVGHHASGTIIDNLPLLRRTVAKTGNGAGEQREIISHALLSLSYCYRCGINLSLLRPLNATATLIGYSRRLRLQTDFEPGSYHRVRGLLRAQPPARRSIPRSAAHI